MREEAALDRLDRAEELFLGGRFEAAETLLRELEPHRFEAPEDTALALHLLACCLDRRGELEVADRAFRRAAALDSEEFHLPPRLEREAFEVWVSEAIAEVPARFGDRLDRLQVFVLAYPEPAPAAPEASVDSAATDPLLLGLYLERPLFDADEDCEQLIHIYQRPHEISFPAERLAVEVRRTVLHEIGHGLGLEEDEIPEAYR